MYGIYVDVARVGLILFQTIDMEGGDHHEEVPEGVIPQEITENEPDIVEEIPDKSSEVLTDSILDDDLVVIPSQSELQQQQELATTEEKLASDPLPVPAGEPEAEPQAVIPASEPSQPVAPPQQVAPPQPEVEPPRSEVEPPQPVTEPPKPVEPAQRQSQPISPPQAQVQAPSSDEPEPSIKLTRPAPANVNVRPNVTSKPTRAIENDDDDDFEDETLTERLMGLSEMFPEALCTVAGVTFSLSISSMKKLFNFSRSALWIGSTSFMILILPIVFETEMVHMEQAQIQRQKQILLGPNAATAGGMTGGLTPPMPGVSVAQPPPESR